VSEEDLAAAAAFALFEQSAREVFAPLRSELASRIAAGRCVPADDPLSTTRRVLGETVCGIPDAHLFDAALEALQALAPAAPLPATAELPSPAAGGAPLCKVHRNAAADPAPAVRPLVSRIAPADVSRALAAHMCAPTSVPGLSLSMLKHAPRNVRNVVVDRATGVAALWWEPRGRGYPCSMCAESAPAHACAAARYTRGEFMRHVIRFHDESRTSVICPLCFVAPSCNPAYRSRNFTGHLQLRHFWSFQHAGVSTGVPPAAWKPSWTHSTESLLVADALAGWRRRHWRR